MCNFFSLVSNGRGRVFYADSEIRKEMEYTTFKPDSHSNLVQWFVDKGEIANKKDVESTFNKYEYNPLTKKFIVGQLNTKDDSEQVEKFCHKLDFKTIVPELIIKPICNPLNKERKRVTQKDIQRLRKWKNVYRSISVSKMNSVYSSVGNSVWESVGNSVWDSVYDSVSESVWGSVDESVRNSVCDSVWYSFRYSVYFSARAYISSFFSLPKWTWIEHKQSENPYQCGADLWESGLVPSFDGKIWRLHTGKNAKIIFGIKNSNL